MILADKIIDERKKNGWSQEELAEQLGVSRQSVSKWESAGSVPDLKKVIQMAELFGVSTDYLLKDELEKENRAVVETSGSDADSPLRRVSMEEANAFLDAKRETAPRLANTVSLFLLSPVALLLLAGIAESPNYNLAEGPAMAVGLAVLLLLTAVGVFIQITDRNKLSCFEYLEREPFETEYGVSGMVKEKKRDYESRYSLGLAGGTAICIVAVIPLLVAGAMDASDLVLFLCAGLLLVLVALGVNLIVRVTQSKRVTIPYSRRGITPRIKSVYRQRWVPFPPRTGASQPQSISAGALGGRTGRRPGSFGWWRASSMVVFTESCV